MNEIKLIVTDLDGTYLQSYHELNRENIKAVAAAQAAGIMVCPVTARNFDCARYAITESNFDAYCVTNNGAAIIDRRTEEHVFHNFLQPEAVRAIVSAAAEANAEIDIFTNQYVATYGPTQLKNMDERLKPWLEKPEHLRRHEHRYQDLEALISENCNIAENITLHGHEREEMPGWLYRRIIEQGEFYLTSSHHMCIDIMAYGSTKIEGVQRLAAILGIDRKNIMAFGDNSNDIGMIRWAGVGVAMGNAPDFVKAAADIVAAPNTEAGFAQEVYKLIESQSK